MNIWKYQTKHATNIYTHCELTLLVTGVEESLELDGGTHTPETGPS